LIEEGRREIADLSRCPLFFDVCFDWKIGWAKVPAVPGTLKQGLPDAAFPMGRALRLFSTDGFSCFLRPRTTGFENAMRALLLALSFVVAATAPTWAADRKIEDFYGRYLGQGTVLRVDPGAPLHEPAQKRMSEVIIGPARGEEGFIITWSTLRAKGNGGQEGAREADVKTYHQTFRAAHDANVYNDVTSGDPLKGQPTSWARITGNTLSIYQLQQDPAGGYFMTQYDRTLTPRGMDVHFTRIENSKIVRAVELKLLRGEMPMREGEDRGRGKDWGRERHDH
jgi:hypothetical protein